MKRITNIVVVLALLVCARISFAQDTESPKEELSKGKEHIVVNIQRVMTNHGITVGLRFSVTNQKNSDKLILAIPAHLEQMFSISVLNNDYVSLYPSRIFPITNPPRHSLISIEPSKSQVWIMPIYKKMTVPQDKLPPAGSYLIKTTVTFSYFHLPASEKDLPPVPNYRGMQLKFVPFPVNLDFGLYNIDIQKIMKKA